MSVLSTRRLSGPLAVVGSGVGVLVVVLILVLGRGGTSVVHAAPALDTDTVTVTGVGTANGAPDALGVDFSVTVTRSTVQSALDAQAAATRSVLAALKRHGVAGANVRTTDLNLNQHYDNHGNITGYDASETLHARLTPLRGAGATISAAATSSGNDVSVGSLSFDLVNDDAVVKAARTDSYDDARSRAQQYADLAGRSLGRVQRISEQIVEPPPVDFYDGLAFHKAAAAGSPVPLRAGQQTLTVRVTVVWTLR